MGWVKLAIFLALAGYALKLYNQVKYEAKLKGIAVAEKQIAESIATAAKDSERETRALMVKNSEVAKVIVAKQVKRKVEYAAQAKSDPVYFAWTQCPVPDIVIDELCARTDPDKTVRGSACDIESRTIVQPKSTPATTISGWPQTKLRDLGPRLRQHFN